MNSNSQDHSPNTENQQNSLETSSENETGLKEQSPSEIQSQTNPASENVEVPEQKPETPEILYADMDLHPDILKALEAMHFKSPTPIQQKSIPPVMKGFDVIGLAQTGSGKTGAFLIPILHKILKNPDQAMPCFMVLAPTRELVMQIAQEGQKILQFTHFKVATLIGGVPYEDQKKQLQGNVVLLVATPGRLLDFVHNRLIDLEKITYLVLDEADRMFDMGFLPDIEFVLQKCHKRQQTMLFSATLSLPVMRLASLHMNDTFEINLQPDQIVTQTIDEKLVHLGSHEKFPYLVNFLQQKNIAGLGIIFSNYKNSINTIVRILNQYGLRAAGLSSQLDQSKRLKLLEDFKRGKYQFLVATDVASRGLDIDQVELVINFDLPMETENYVHRIGRTARAGRSGQALSFCTEKDYHELMKIEEYVKHKIESLEINESFLQFPNTGIERKIGREFNRQEVTRIAAQENISSQPYALEMHETKPHETKQQSSLENPKPQGNSRPKEGAPAHKAQVQRSPQDGPKLSFKGPDIKPKNPQDKPKAASEQGNEQRHSKRHPHDQRYRERFQSPEAKAAFLGNKKGAKGADPKNKQGKNTKGGQGSNTQSEEKVSFWNRVKSWWNG